VKLLISCLAVLAALLPMHAADYSFVGLKLATWISLEMSEWQLGGMAVALVDDQQIVFLNGFGEAKADSVFRCGSISKLFNALAVMQQVEQRKGEIPDEEDMAKAMKITVEEYRQLLDEIRPVSFVSLDAVMGNEEVDGTDPYESLPDESQENPVDGVSRRELTRLILERLQKLPETQRKVLALYYFEDLRLREIAEAFNLTESRICQIHVQAILNRRLGEPLSLADISKAIGVSPYHLCRVFRRHTGVPIHRYRDRLRLFASLDMILERTHSVLDIALTLGYANEAHFSDAFRRTFGTRPGAYRRTVRGARKKGETR